MKGIILVLILGLVLLSGCYQTPDILNDRGDAKYYYAKEYCEDKGQTFIGMSLFVNKITVDCRNKEHIERSYLIYSPNCGCN